MNTITELESLNPCHEGLAFVRQFSSLEEAWNNCKKSEWMWWFLRQTNQCDKQLSIIYSKQCAEHVSHLKNVADIYVDAAASVAIINVASFAVNAAAASASAVNAVNAAASAASASASFAVNAAASAAASAVNAAASAAVVDAFAYIDAPAYVAAYIAGAAAESKWQANLLRTLINPFQK